MRGLSNSRNRLLGTKFLGFEDYFDTNLYFSISETDADDSSVECVKKEYATTANSS